jgi:branched-chain amino acid transport system permease protein
MDRSNTLALFGLVLCMLLLPVLTGGTYVLTVGVFAGINALVAIGLCVLMGYAGQVSLGQAGFYAIGAYVSSIMSLKFAVPVPLSMVIALVAASLIAALVAVPALRLRGHYLAVATLGFGEIINVILNEWAPGGPSGFGDIPRFAVFGHALTSTTEYFFLVWGCVCVVMVFSLNVLDSRTGRALRAIHGSETACIAMGLDIAALKIKVFVLSAVYAALAGGLYAHYVTFVSPAGFSLSYSILVLMMAIAGGITNVWGGVIGAVAITILPELLRQFREFDILVYGLILTLSLLFFRKGIVPLVIEKLKREKEPADARS